MKIFSKSYDLITGNLIAQWGHFGHETIISPEVITNLFLYILKFDFNVTYLQQLKNFELILGILDLNMIVVFIQSLIKIYSLNTRVFPLFRRVYVRYRIIITEF